MLYFVDILLLSAACVTCDSGFEAKIINGVVSFIEDYPYMASIQLSGSHFCGGSILDDDTVLTAAHCLKAVKLLAFLPYSWYLNVQVGSARIGARAGQSISVLHAFAHPQYDPKTSDYDIAVLKLRGKLKFGDAVKGIELATERVPPGTIAKAAGWGKTSVNSGLAAMLHSVDMPVLDQDTCVKSYPDEKISIRMMCAGYLEGGKDSCQGDSGGPLVVNNTVIGVVSWGYGCAERGHPGVFSDVSQMVDFIEKSRQ